MKSRLFLAAPALALAALLAACAGNPYKVQPGTPREQLQSLGTPTGSYALANGNSRLQYSQQPLGRAVYNIDLDAGGKVVAVEQALQESGFAHVVVDQSAVADVQREFGRPAMIDRVASFDGSVWTYRYRDAVGPRLYYVFIDQGGVVRRAYNTDELFNAPDRNSK